MVMVIMMGRAANLTLLALQLCAAQEKRECALQIGSRVPIMLVGVGQEPSSPNVTALYQRLAP